jgi:hypothetical protein
VKRNDEGFPTGMFYDRAGNDIDWERWQELWADRHMLADEIGASRVSTIYTGLSAGIGPVPMIFETMVFGGKLDGRICRWATEDSALAGHAAVVDLVRAAEQGENETSG